MNSEIISLLKQKEYYIACNVCQYFIPNIKYKEHLAKCRLDRSKLPRSCKTNNCFFFVKENDEYCWKHDKLKILN